MLKRITIALVSVCILFGMISIIQEPCATSAGFFI